MKKIMKVLLAAAVFAGTVMMTGCGLGERIKETYNTWYQYNKEGGLSIPVSDASDSDSLADSTGKMMENAEIYVYYDDDEGLTLAVQSTKAQDIELAGGLLSTTVDVVTGGTKQYTKAEFGAVKWTALMASGAFSESRTPKVVADPDHCVILTGEGENKFSFQWKKVLKRIILQQLLGEDL